MTPSFWRPRLEFAAKAFLWCAFFGSLAAGAIRVHAQALEAPAHRVDLGAWSVRSRPDWCTDDDLREVRREAGLEGRWTSLLDPAAGAEVWRRIESAPHVRRVVAMRRRLPNRFEALVEMRRPVAVVRVPNGTGRGASSAWIEVDESGRALTAPLPDRPVRAGRPLRSITGAAGGVPEPGAHFGTDVVEAAALAAEFERFSSSGTRDALDVLDEIDVSNHGGRKDRGASEILLRSTAVPAAAAGTAGRRPPACVVEWGRSRAADAYDPEPTFGAKASRTLQALRMFPGLEGLARVRVAFEDLVVVPHAAPARR